MPLDEDEDLCSHRSTNETAGPRAEQMEIYNQLRQQAAQPWILRGRGGCRNIIRQSSKGTLWSEGAVELDTSTGVQSVCPGTKQGAAFAYDTGAGNVGGEGES